MGDGVSREGGCVMGDADHDGPSIGEQIIDAVRDGDARGIGAEVVIVDPAGRQIPARPHHHRPRSIYRPACMKSLQILSLTMFEKIPLDQLLAQTIRHQIQLVSDNQLILFT
jgi:hypothetical protein